MTRFEELQQAGRALRPEDVTSQIANLATDGRFPAVLEAIRRSAENYRAAGTAQVVASDHGRLAWNAGATFALETLLKQLQSRVDRDTGRRREDQPPE